MCVNHTFWNIVKSVVSDFSKCGSLSLIPCYRLFQVSPAMQQTPTKTVTWTTITILLLFMILWARMWVGFGWAIPLFHLLTTEVTWWYSVGRGPKMASLTCLVLVSNGWKAGLSWNCQLENPCMACPIWPSQGRQLDFFHGHSGLQEPLSPQTRRPCPWPSLRSHTTSLPLYSYQSKQSQAYPDSRGGNIVPISWDVIFPL